MLQCFHFMMYTKNRIHTDYILSVVCTLIHIQKVSEYTVIIMDAPICHNIILFAKS